MKHLFIFLLSLVLLFSPSCNKKHSPSVPEKSDAESAVHANTANSQKKKTARPHDITDYIGIEGSVNGRVLHGDRRLYLARAGESRQLFLEQQDGTKIQLTHHSNAVDDYSVSPDERYVAYLVSDGGNEQYDIYLLNMKTRTAYPLLADAKVRYDNPVWADNRTILYMSNEVTKRDFYLFSYDIKSGQKRLLVKKKGMNIPTDARSANDFLFITFKGNNITVPYRYLNGKVKKIKGATKKRSYIPIGYFGDGILMKTNEKHDLPYLELWKNGTKQPVYMHQRWGVTSAVIEKRNRHKAFFCVNNSGYSNCFLFEKGKGTPKLLPLSKGVILPTQLVARGAVYTLHRPNAVYRPVVFDFRGNKELPFGYVNTNGIAVSSFVEPQLHTVLSFDKTPIPYFLYLPKTGTKPYKTIVYFHGGPSSQFRPYFISSFQYFLSKGYAVVAPNVRGSSGYGQAFEDADNYKKRMHAVKDGFAVVQRLIATGISQPHSLIAMGGSYGGFMSVASMATYPSLYKCGIDTVGVVDFINFLSNTKSYRRKLREVEYGPLSDKKFLASISPVNMVDTIAGKLFIAHGANDPRVPVSDAYRLKQKMESAGKAVKTLIFDDEGHGFRKKENRLKYYKAVANFIENDCK